MILYHGSNVEIRQIDLNKSARGKDFGKGFYLSEDEKQAEAEKAAHIITVITGAYNGNVSVESMFDNGDGNSKTGESAQSLVDDVMNSEIAKEMIGSAVKNNSTDPYNISNALSQEDLSSLQDVLSSRLDEATGTKDKQSINDIATLFGLDLSLVP